MTHIDENAAPGTFVLDEDAIPGIVLQCIRGDAIVLQDRGEGDGPASYAAASIDLSPACGDHLADMDVLAERFEALVIALAGAVNAWPAGRPLHPLNRSADGWIDPLLDRDEGSAAGWIDPLDRDGARGAVRTDALTAVDTLGHLQTVWHSQFSTPELTALAGVKAAIERIANSRPS